MSDVSTNSTSFFDRIAGHAIAGIIFLTPVFFSPFFGINVLSAKFFLLFVLTVVAFVAYLLARSNDKLVVLPSKRATLLTALVPVTFLLSAIATGRFRDSFLGFGYEATTVLFMIMMAVLTVLMSVYARSEKAPSRVIQIVTGSFAVVAAYQVIRLLATFVYQNASSDVLSVGGFTGTYGNLLGKWNDVSLLSSLVMLATIIYWRSLDKRGKYVAGSLFVISGFLMKVVGFSMVWPLLAVLLIVYVLKDSVVAGKATLFKGGAENKFRTAVFALAIVMVLYSALQGFSLKRNSVGYIMHPRINSVVYLAPNLFGGVPTELRPSISESLTVYKDTIKHNPVFGVGPNRYVESWMLYRPESVNLKVSPDSDFAYGFSYILTLLTSIGLLGGIALVLFVLFALKQSAIVALAKTSSNAERTIAYGTLFLLITSILYVPAPVLIAYMFMGIGVVFAKTGKFEVQLRKGLLAKGLVAVVVIGSISTTYVLIKEYRANRYFNLAVQAISVDKNIDSAEIYLTKAVSLHNADIYYRATSELNTLKASVIASQSTGQDGKITDDGKAAALKSYQQGEAFADKAIAVSPHNYVNYLYAARVYGDDPTKLDTAQDLYNKALVYTPNNPNVYLGLAKISAQKGDIQTTKDNIQKALKIRPMFTDALLAAAQVTYAEKDVPNTIDLTLRAYMSDQTKVELLVSVAQLQYEVQNDIKSATQTLEYLVSHHPEYPQGRLALANLYAKQSNFVDAANLLVGVKVDDKKTQDVVDQYITALKAGKDPFVATSTKTTTASSTAKTATKK